MFKIESGVTWILPIQPRASCKHVNITLEIIFSAKFDGYIAAMRLCVCEERCGERKECLHL